MEMDLEVHEVLRTDPRELLAPLAVDGVDAVEVGPNVALGLLELVVLVGLLDEGLQA